MSAIEQPAARSGKITFCSRRGQDVGRLGHEVHAAEHDELSIRARCRFAGQLEGVAGDIGELDHLVALVVMAKHEEPIAQCRLRPPGPLHECRVGGWRQVAWTFDSPLGSRVGFPPEDEQR